MPVIMYTGANVLSHIDLKNLMRYDIFLVIFKTMVQNFSILSF